MNAASLAGVVALLVGSSGCGMDDESDVAPSTSVSTTMTVAGDDAASGSRTVDHVVVGGVTYEVTCAKPSEAQLGAEVELDGSDARFSGAAEIAGEDPEDVVALRAEGRVERCPDAMWVMGVAGPNPVDAPTTSELARLLCAVPASPDDPRCDEGGPFWYGTDPSVDGTGGDGRSAIWVEGDAPPAQWRLDPLEVVAREIDLESPVPEFYRLRRVGLRVLDERDDEVLVEVLYQDITDNAGEPWGTEQREHHTVRKLPGRTGWYPTTYIVADYADGNTDAAALDAAWAEGLDRILVEVDRR